MQVIFVEKLLDLLDICGIVLCLKDRDTMTTLENFFFGNINQSEYKQSKDTGNKLSELTELLDEMKHNCTVHNIRESVINQIVLENLRKVTTFARSEPEKFYEIAMQKGKSEADKIAESDTGKGFR